MGERCARCGVDRGELSIGEAADMIERFGPEYRDVVAGVGVGSPRLRARPAPEVWSPLEYLVHVRDLIRYHGWLANRTLTQDRPEVPAPDPDAITANEAYNDADPSEVLDGIAQQSLRFAGRAREFSGTDLDRVAIRAGTPVSVRFMVTNVAHEGHHHLLDVQWLLA